MPASDHWNLGKITKMLSCWAICISSCLVVTLFFSPLSETLLQVSPERLFLYSMVFGCLLLVSGELVGLFENSARRMTGKGGVSSRINHAPAPRTSASASQANRWAYSISSPVADRMDCIHEDDPRHKRAPKVRQTPGWDRTRMAHSSRYNCNYIIAQPILSGNSTVQPCTQSSV